ncbi:MBL fold metallo-hydrolase [Kitasatospora sp. CB01950]|uniref:MBL fold metallo-hydrolase n=1 Tax=Kitasatospora sp. CB01950 TaxID=1703930 RepID=UPI00093F08C0|nr:MBL fold metallo-hydrolase [Kitasatospora sp. CB01950]
MTASSPDESAEGRGAGAVPPFRPLEVEVFTGPESAFFATSSLIMGERTAILVDAQLTRSAGRELAEWIAGKNRQLLAIVITHQHPDHYFGAEEVLRLFPAAPLLAAPSVVDGIRQTAAAKVAQWKPVYGDDIPDRPLLPAPLLPQPLMIDGQLIRVLPLGQADSAGSTAVYLPSVRTVVAGDFVYNGTHVWTADTDPAARGRWSHNLSRIADLGVDRVIAGHRAPGMDDAAHRVLGFTAEYLRDFDEALADHPQDAEALATAVNERYGGLTLPAILELGAAANVARAIVPEEDNGIVDAEIVEESDEDRDDSAGGGAGDDR